MSYVVGEVRKYTASFGDACREIIYLVLEVTGDEVLTLFLHVGYPRYVTSSTTHWINTRQPLFFRSEGFCDVWAARIRRRVDQ